MRADNLVNVSKVLAAVGFGDLTDRIIRTAADFTKAYGAELEVIYANRFEPPVYLAGARARADVDGHRQAATIYLEQRVEAVVGDSLAWTSRLVEAKPAEAILKTAAEGDADLIVLGAHRRTGLRRMMLGAVPEAVLRETEIPLLTVRGPGDRSALPFERILCPVNFNTTTAETFVFAANLADRCGASLTVMTCLESGEEGGRSEADVARDLRELVSVHAGTVEDVRPLVAPGEAARRILQTAAEGAFDLIVLGAEHKPLLESTVFGTTGVNVMRHARCSVLSIVRFPD